MVGILIAVERERKMMVPTWMTDVDRISRTRPERIVLNEICLFSVSPTVNALVRCCT